MRELERRRVATQATLDRFRGSEFDWERNCLHLAVAQLRAMGHAMPPVPDMATALDAKREMKARGWDSVADMMDWLLPGSRIAPAMMLTGDIGVLPGVGLDAIVICAGPLKFFGWAEETGRLEVIEVSLDDFIGAWRA